LCTRAKPPKKKNTGDENQPIKPPIPEGKPIIPSDSIVPPFVISDYSIFHL
jgi:hypothetical protein